MACRESYATTCQPTYSYDTHKDRDRRTVPSLRTAFWGRGDDKKLSALSTRLVRWLSVGLKANLFGYLSPFLLQSTQEKGDSC